MAGGGSAGVLSAVVQAEGVTKGRSATPNKRCESQKRAKTHVSQLFPQLHSPVQLSSEPGLAHSTLSPLALAPHASTTSSAPQKHFFVRTSSHPPHSPSWHILSQLCRPQLSMRPHVCAQLSASASGPAPVVGRFTVAHRTALRSLWQ